MGCEVGTDDGVAVVGALVGTNVTPELTAHPYVMISLMKIQPPLLRPTCSAKEDVVMGAKLRSNRKGFGTRGVLNVAERLPPLL